MPSFQGSTCLDLTVSITWAAVNDSNYINGCFRIVLPSQPILSGLLDAAGLVYCPGFFDVLQAEAPPSSDWIEKLSTSIPFNVWGVYVMVLRRTGNKPLLYIGSGTSSKTGVRARLGEYDRGVLLPRYLDKALKKGYNIVHKALLLSCPIPTSANIPTFRVALTAVEAALACVFGAFHNRNKKYGFGDLCPWSQDLFEWHGLCSHSPLLEQPAGDLSLDSEQLEAMAAMAKERVRQNGVEYQQNRRANPTPEYKEGQRLNNQKQRPALKVIHANRVANKTFYCNVCKVSCRNKQDLEKHNKTPRHSKKLEMGDNDYHCDVCDLSYRYKSAFAQHNASRAHLAKVAP